MRTRLSVFATAIAFFLLSACGDSGKWVEAPDTLAMYAGMDKARQMTEQIEQNRAPNAEKRSCPELLEQMREHIAKAEPGNLMFQQMVRNCGDLGMQFGEEVRCESGRLQVKCK